MCNKFKMNSVCRRLSHFMVVLLILNSSLNNVAAQPGTTAGLLVRLNNNTLRGVAPTSGLREGRVEVSTDGGATWGSLCSTRWSNREGNVVCRQLGLGYAAMTNQTTRFGDSQQHPWLRVGTLCRGNEPRLGDCLRESNYPSFCDPQRNLNVAVVRCEAQLADLSLGLRDIETSARLESIPMSRLTCAMEEKCVSSDAYTIRLTQPNAVRHLLRFTTKAENVGSADFRPIGSYDTWQWHQCHNHFHSMETFASFDVYDLQYNKVAQGHKASFCLEDSACVRGISRRYTCSSRLQGISIGCADYYTANLDCQWVDVTNLPRNRQYLLRIALNPEYAVGEISYENNGAECRLFYTGNRRTTRVTQCRSVSLWFKMPGRDRP